MEKAAQHIAFILHGRLEKKQLAQSLSAVFHGHDCSFHYTRSPFDASVIAASCVGRGVRILIAVGGDGTLHEVVNGIMQCSEQERNDVCIGVLPYGSGNDFVRSVGITKNAQSLRAYIEKQNIRLCDVLRLQCLNEQGSAYVRYCINVADAGLGGLVARIVNQSPAWLGADLKYMLGVLRGFLRFRKADLCIEYQDAQEDMKEDNQEIHRWEGRCMSICMANGIYFGSGLGIAPDARTEDGIADLTIVGDVHLWDYLRSLPAIKKAKRLALPQVLYLRARSCRISSTLPFPLEIDGEFAGTTPVEMKVLPQAIRVFAP